MPRFFRKRSRKTGLAPGSLVFVGKKRKEPIAIQHLSYNLKEYHDEKISDLATLENTVQHPFVHWINIDGVYDPEVIAKFGKMFRIHPLLLEDVLNTAHRPKFEELEGHLLVIVKMLFWQEKENRVSSEQVSLILGKNYVLSFQEESGDHFDPVRHRIKDNIGRIRRVGADYLEYALVDAIVDHYFYILEKMGEKIEALQAEVVNKPSKETLDRVYQLKSELLFVRKAIYPLREVFSQLGKGDSTFFDKATFKYLRDLYDHAIQIVEGVEIYREMTTEMVNIYLSSLSNKMNMEMRTLSIVATIFIPLTFIAGVYGMNFKYMPELDEHWGYPLILFVMVVVAIGMIFFFRSRKWF